MMLAPKNTHSDLPRSYAFLGASFLTEIQTMLWKGALKAASETGVNLLCYPINSLSTKVDFFAQANILLDFVSGHRSDGLVVWAGGMFGNDAPHEIEHIFKQFEHIPLVTIGGPIQNFPDISTSNYLGMKDAVSHLVDVHKYQQFGIIRGPLYHPEADARHKACLDALAHYSISLNSLHIAQGAFDLPTGQNLARDATSQWLEDGTELDCIIAATDFMALAAIESIRSFGLRVPQDIAVIGFDDLLEGKASHPPLTTVRNPFYELGYQATKLLDDLVDQKSISRTNLLAAKLLIRESCGCKSSSISLADNQVSQLQDAQFRFPDMIDDKLLNDLMEVTESVQLSSEHLGHLITTCLSDMQGITSHTFIDSIKESILEFGKAHMNLMIWQDIITILRRYVLSVSEDNLTVEHDTIFHKARLLVAEASQNILINQQVQYERQIAKLNEASTELITSFETNLLLETIQNELGKIGIPSFYLSLYVNSENPVAESRLILAYEEGKMLELPAEGIIFPTKQLGPEFLLASQRKKTLIVESLYFRDQQLGILLLESNPNLSTEYESLRSYVSSALRGAQLVQQTQENNLELEQANEELKTFTYTVAHDLRTPLRSANGFSQILLNDYADQLDDDGKHYLNRIHKSTVRMGTLIDDLLQLARVTKHKMQLQAIDLSEMTSQILHDLAENSPDRQLTLDIEEAIVVRGDGGLLRIMLENLLNNAWKFTSKQTSAKIEFGTSKKQAETTYFVRDNGVGFDMDFYSKIFLPFERLHKDENFEGTGIGLATVQRIIHRHHGRIWAESAVGEGTTFYFTIEI